MKNEEFGRKLKCPKCGEELEGRWIRVRTVPQKKCPRCGNNSYCQDREGNWHCVFGLCNYPDEPDFGEILID